MISTEVSSLAAHNIRDGKNQYLLLLKDDLSGYLWLLPCRTADAAATGDALM
jgi:hypothetical protein